MLTEGIIGWDDMVGCVGVVGWVGIVGCVGIVVVGLVGMVVVGMVVVGAVARNSWPRAAPAGNLPVVRLV